MTDVNDILFRYVETRSEEVFGELVERLLPLVYSAALRQVNGDAALASDVAQMVFSDLALKAATLPRKIVLSGWIYRHTCFTAAKAVRSERRRKAREEEAVQMQNLNNSPEAAWKQIAPLLDEAMNGLGATDRNAIVLLFFDGLDLHRVGQALGTNEDAAQKRVARALEKLRRFFARKGVVLSTAGLAGVLGAHGVAAAPAGLATLVAGGAMAVAVTGASSFPLTLGTFIIMQKLKAITLGAVVAAGVATPLFLQQQTIQRLRAEVGALQEQRLKLEQEQSKPHETLLSAGEEERLKNEHAELLRLRGESARLRGQQLELVRLQEENKRLLAGKDGKPAANAVNFVASETWADVGFASPLDSLQTAHWAVRHGNIEKFKESVVVTDAAKKFLNSLLAGAPPEAVAEAKKLGYGVEEGLLFPMMAQDRKQGYKGYKVVAQENPSPDDIMLRIELEMNSGNSQKQAMRFQRFGSDWKHVIDVVDLEPPEEKQAAH